MELGDPSEVNEDNYAPVDESKLKEDQQKEYLELVDRFKRECLKSYSVTRSGDVIKKFDLPSFQLLTEAQRENKMVDTISQAVAQAFIKSTIVMGNTVHNAVVKTFAEGTFPGCVGPCYIQLDQMNYVPLEVSMAVALSAQNSQPEASNSHASKQATTATSTAPTAPVYSTTPPIPTTMQGGSASGFPKGWNPATGYGVPPDFFTPKSNAQFNASFSQPMAPQPDPSATQPMGSQQDVSAAQHTAPNTWSTQMSAQFNTSAPPPMTPQQHLALLLQPKSPSEILVSKSPHVSGLS